MPTDDYTLSELTEAAEVSARTVRYYISEGLLPPPDVAGPRSSYSRVHLNRLLLIGRLKNAYLPLKEIRRRLDAMSDAEIEVMVQQSGTIDELAAPPHGAGSRGDAASYIAEILRHRPPRQTASSPASLSIVDRPIAFPGPRRQDEDAAPAAVPPAAPLEAPGSDIDRHALGASWRRIALGPDAELLIREDAFDRKRDRVEWLINWAKRVFN